MCPLLNTQIITQIDPNIKTKRSERCYSSSLSPIIRTVSERDSRRPLGETKFFKKLGFILDALRNGVFRLTASTELGQNTVSPFVNRPPFYPGRDGIYVKLSAIVGDQPSE